MPSAVLLVCTSSASSELCLQKGVRFSVWSAFYCALVSVGISQGYWRTLSSALRVASSLQVITGWQSNHYLAVVFL